MEFLRLYGAVLFFVLISFFSVGQNNPYWQESSRKQTDGLKQVLKSTNNDSILMYVNCQLGLYYQEIKRQVALTYFEEQLKLAQKLNQKIWAAEAHGGTITIKSKENNSTEFIISIPTQS